MVRAELDRNDVGYFVFLCGCAHSEADLVLCSADKLPFYETPILQLERIGQSSQCKAHRTTVMKHSRLNLFIFLYSVSLLILTVA
jgi:hypothetical protein